MNCNEIELLINKYLDKEIEKSDEPVLFTHLANCNNCREEFRLLNGAQKAFKESLEEYPEQLERRIISSMKKKETRKKGSVFLRPIPAVYLYAASIAVLFLLTLYFIRVYEFNQIMSEDKLRMKTILTREYEQEQHLKGIINLIPSVKVKAEVNDPKLIQKDM
jgi:hypothetical protein